MKSEFLFRSWILVLIFIVSPCLTSEQIGSDLSAVQIIQCSDLNFININPRPIILMEVPLLLLSTEKSSCTAIRIVPDPEFVENYERLIKDSLNKELFHYIQQYYIVRVFRETQNKGKLICTSKPVFANQVYYELIEQNEVIMYPLNFNDFPNDKLTLLIYQEKYQIYSVDPTLQLVDTEGEIIHIQFLEIKLGFKNLRMYKVESQGNIREFQVLLQSSNILFLNQSSDHNIQFQLIFNTHLRNHNPKNEITPVILNSIEEEAVFEFRLSQSSSEQFIQVYQCYGGIQIGLLFGNSKNIAEDDFNLPRDSKDGLLMSNTIWLNSRESLGFVKFSLNSQDGTKNESLILVNHLTFPKQHVSIFEHLKIPNLGSSLIYMYDENKSVINYPQIEIDDGYFVKPNNILIKDVEYYEFMAFTEEAIESVFYCSDLLDDTKKEIKLSNFSKQKGLDPLKEGPNKIYLNKNNNLRVDTFIRIKVVLRIEILEEQFDKGLRYLSLYYPMGKIQAVPQE